MTIKKTKPKKLTRPQKKERIEEIMFEATAMRRWVMIRSGEDQSGVSGLGLVAAGVEFANGKVSGSFLSKFPGTFSYDAMSIAQNVHSHFGDQDTKLMYVDNLTDEERDALLNLLESKVSEQSSNG